MADARFPESPGICGARGRVEDPEAVLRRAQQWASSRNGEFLLADARAVFGVDHAASAVWHASRAKREGRMAARGLAIETLLYLTGQRQVSDAIKTGGIRVGTESILVVSFGPVRLDELLAHLGFVRDDHVLEPKGKDLRILVASARALGTLSPERRHELALERTALLDVFK